MADVHRVEGAAGRDRWLKRIDVVRDLRTSREARLSAASRVLY